MIYSLKFTKLQEVGLLSGNENTKIFIQTNFLKKFNFFLSLP